MQAISACLLPILPLLAFVELLAYFMGRSGKLSSQADHSWRAAFLYAATIWATLTFVFTELLSLPSALNSLSLAACWGLVCLALLLALRFDLVRNLSKYLRPSFKGLPISQKALLLWIVFCLGITALIAVVSAPNNWDSMTYHMSRVAHWWADNTVAFYPTNIVRQLYSGPLAEYVVLQFFVLSGGSDRLANLVQWFSLGGCAIAMSLIADRLGADRFTRYLVAFVVLTTPILILESSSTQNDVVCAFLVAATLYFLYSGKATLTGLGMGLAILAKSTAGLFILPFLVLVFFFESLVKHARLKAATKLALIASIVLVINAPQWLRNIQTFKNPLGFATQVNWIESQTLGPGPFAANLMKNLAIELETPWPRISNAEENAIRAVCKVLRLDPDDPRNTFQGVRFYVGTMGDGEDNASNPLQTALLIAAALFFMLSHRFRHSQILKFTVCVWVGFLLMAWRLSWQPWMSRLHAPFLVLSSLPIGVYLGEIRRYSRFITGAIIAVLAVMSLLPLLHNQNCSLVSIRGKHETVFTTARSDEYFTDRPEDRSCYEDAIEILSLTACRTVGLDLSEDQYEYPLWALSRLRGTPMRFEHLNVDNETKTAKAGFQGAPCAVIVIHDAKTGPEPKPAWMELHRHVLNSPESVDRIECRQ